MRASATASSAMGWLSGTGDLLEGEFGGGGVVQHADAGCAGEPGGPAAWPGTLRGASRGARAGGGALGVEPLDLGGQGEDVAAGRGQELPQRGRRVVRPRVPVVLGYD